MATQFETYTFDELQPAQNPQDARTDAVAFGASLTIAKGTAIGIKTSDKLAYAYSNAAADGTETCVGIAKFSFKTDANGKVYRVSGATAAEASRLVGPESTAPIYTQGTFVAADLTGVDAAAIADLQGRTLHNGFIKFP